MKKVLFPAAAAFLLSMIGLAGAGQCGALNEADSFRCGNDLVYRGDSCADVLMKCGEPSFVRQTGARGKSKTVTRKAAEKSVAEVPDKAPRKKKTAVKKTVYDETLQEVWSYNLGPNDFIYNLHFDGGVLKKIEVGGRGK